MSKENRWTPEVRHVKRFHRFCMSLAAFSLLSLLWPFDAFRPDAPAAEAYARGAPITLLEPVDVQFLAFPDEWHGATQRSLFELPFALPPAVAGVSQQVLALPPSHRVIPGTQWLDLTVSAKAADQSRPDLHLLARAASGETRYFPLPYDGTIRMNIAETMNDWAPDPNSRWAFTIVSESFTYVQGRLAVAIGREDAPLPPYIEYRDGWQGADRVLVFRETDRLQDAQLAQFEGGPLVGGSPTPSPRLRDVPATDLAVVRLTLYYNSSTPTEQHYRPLLNWHGANRVGSDWEERAVKPTRQHPAQTNGVFSWDIPVEPRMWDSPFASQTRWGFQVNWHGSTDAHATYMDGNFHWRVEAIRGPTPVLT